MPGSEHGHKGILIAVPTVQEAGSFAVAGSIPFSRGAVSPGRVGKKQVNILITGVGIPDALNNLALATEKPFLPRLVVHAGIAGSYTGAYPPGSVVLIEKDCFADVGVYHSNRIHSLSERNLAGRNAFPYSDGWIEIPGAAEWAEKLGLPCVKARTVATACSPLLRNDERCPEAAVETMEGASVALFCRSRNIPLIHIRAVSNYVSQTDSRLWDFRSAFAALRETVAGILDLTGAL